MQGKIKKQYYQKQAMALENRGFNSALYFNALNFQKEKLEIDTRDYKLEKRRKIGKDTTPKSIDTPQSCTSNIDLKLCISNDLYRKIDESSPIKSHGSREEYEVINEDYEVITPDFENFDESSDNIIINLQNATIEEADESTQQTSHTQNYPNTQSYFYRENNFINYNQNCQNSQYNSHPNMIVFPNANPINPIPINPMYYFKPNNSEGNLLINNKTDFSKLFKVNDYKKEEINNQIKKKDNKNITKKTINNQDIKGWTCNQCKNFNYESNYNF